MKQFLSLFAFIFPLLSFGQYDGNTTPDYPELIKIYQKLSAEHQEIELYEMGDSDYGLPIYVCILNGAGDSLKTFAKAKQGTTILINNAIHPGEPDGVNACLIWIDNWIKEGNKTGDLPLIAIIPAYNVGGMMNRSGTSRANQDGPEEYGFRGNAQNLDLNRDFIKMDSKNMFTFTKIYHGLDPDVFLDTHVSNGADYQYTMTYIASVRERMAPALGALMHDQMIPYLESSSSEKGFDLTPYVHLKGATPETGIMVFNDLPRYAMGYASLMNAISFTLETHMLKPFPERVQATLAFIESTLDWMTDHQAEIEKARSQSMEWELDMSHYFYNYELTDQKDSLLFKGYGYSKPVGEVTGVERLKYHHNRPYEKYVPYYHRYEPKDSTFIPDFIVVGGQCQDVINRLQANGVEMTINSDPNSLQLGSVQIHAFENGTRPYEGHFLHSKVKAETVLSLVEFKPGDAFISTRQKNKRFIMSVLDPESPDSYFAWNFFDSYVQQKEYFSPYVFEDKAKDILKSNPGLKTRLEKRKSEDEDFAKSSWEQLYFIYQNSEFYEPTHNFLPVFMGMSNIGEK